jgi:hypothetical protein
MMFGELFKTSDDELSPQSLFPVYCLWGFVMLLLRFLMALFCFIEFFHLNLDEILLLFLPTESLLNRCCVVVGLLLLLEELLTKMFVFISI